ncbi:MAG: DUF4743 domain-containing protein [Burkholderiales bacterium]
MIDDALQQAIERRLSTSLAPPSAYYLPFAIDDAPVGWVAPARAMRLAAFTGVFRMNNAVMRFVPGLEDADQRTAAMAQVAATLAREGALTAWRDEQYAVAPGFGAVPFFLIERAAARHFGIQTYAAHVNGLVAAGDGPRMWLARRSATKSIDPAMLDNLVGGGIASGHTVAGTVIKEAWEEAGIERAVAERAQAFGTLRIRRDQPDGLQHETIFVHDLWLPADFVPANQDGEAVEHRCVTLPEAARLIALTSGPDVVTADASLVVADCLARHGVVDVARLPTLAGARL